MASSTGEGERVDGRFWRGGIYYRQACAEGVKGDLNGRVHEDIMRSILRRGAEALGSLGESEAGDRWAQTLADLEAGGEVDWTIL
jgi:hypothetical protein